MNFQFFEITTLCQPKSKVVYWITYILETAQLIQNELLWLLWHRYGSLNHRCTDFYFRKVCKLCVMHLTFLICQKCFLKEWYKTPKNNKVLTQFLVTQNFQLSRLCAPNRYPRFPFWLNFEKYSYPIMTFILWRWVDFRSTANFCNRCKFCHKLPKSHCLKDGL